MAVAGAVIISAVASLLALWMLRAPPEAIAPPEMVLAAAPAPIESARAPVTHQPAPPAEARPARARPAAVQKAISREEAPAAGSRAARTLRENRVRSGATPRTGAPTSAATGPGAGLVVITEPDGARVTINGVGYGATPLTIPYLPPGAKRVRVTKTGYETEERVVSAEGSPGSPIRIELRRATAPVPP